MNSELSKNTPKNVDCYNICSSAFLNKQQVKMAGYRQVLFCVFMDQVEVEVDKRAKNIKVNIQSN